MKNRTPHPLNILPASGSTDPRDALDLRPEGRDGIARVRTTHRIVDDLRFKYLDARPVLSLDSGPLPSAGSPIITIDVVATQWGEPINIGPGPQVVSAIVAASMVARGLDTSQTFVPADQVRDDEGRIVGCRGLVRAIDAMPRLGPPPMVVVFGSAARWVAARTMGDKDLPLPRDIDVGYCGMDPRTALNIVERWCWRGHMPDASIDLRCLRWSDQLAVPRPGALPGEDGSCPLDGATATIFGRRDQVVFKDSHDLPALVRRAEQLLAVDPVETEKIGKMLGNALALRHVLVLCDVPPNSVVEGDAYDAPTLGALHRAVGRLRCTSEGTNAWGWALNQLGQAGRFIDRLLVASREEVNRLRALVCSDGNAASKAPRWQQSAGRLLVSAAGVGSEYGLPVELARALAAIGG